MPGNFSGGSFSGAVGGFSVDAVAGADVVRVSTGGGIDPGEGLRRRTIVKPTGLVERKEKEARKDVEDRVDDTREIHAEIAGKLARELRGDIDRAAVEMTMAEVDQEIGVLLRKVHRTQEEELLLLMLMAAV